MAITGQKIIQISLRLAGMAFHGGFAKLSYHSVQVTGRCFF